LRQEYENLCGEVLRSVEEEALPFVTMPSSNYNAVTDSNYVFLKEAMVMQVVKKLCGSLPWLGKPPLNPVLNLLSNRLIL
jgi:hypothetical protein